MAKKSRADKPHDPVPTSNPAYLRSGFKLEDCMRAETKVARILREKLGETRDLAQQVLIAMLPALTGQKKLEITHDAVRIALQKVLSTDE